MNIFLRIISNIVLGAQKDRLIEIIDLKIYHICFGREKRKIIFNYMLFIHVHRGLQMYTDMFRINYMQCQNREKITL